MFGISSKNHWCRTLCYFVQGVWDFKKEWDFVAHTTYLYSPLLTSAMGKSAALKYISTFPGNSESGKIMW